MLNRFLITTTGLMLCLVLSLSVAKLGAGWRWWAPRDLNRATEAVSEVMRTVNAYYIDEKAVTPTDLQSAALNGVLHQLDPYSQYMLPDDYRLLKEDIDGEFGGIGVQVEVKDGHLVIVEPMPGGPSDRAGILRGDRIVSINGTKIETPRIDHIALGLRGKPGTTVSIGLFRPSLEQELTFTIKRERIHVDSIRNAHLLPNTSGIGYLFIAQFSEQAGKEFNDALNKLLKDGAKALIIDLRNNPGGLLEAATSVVEPFFSGNELIVYTQGRSTDDKQEMRARRRKTPPLAIPLAVLINDSSASAAEIVTGALKDTKRAIIVGEKSFRKDSVQTVFNMRGGAGLRLTTARYYTPSGALIHGVGIEPDIEVKLSPDEERSVRMSQFYPGITDPVEFKNRFKVELTEDFQLATAITTLKEKLTEAKK